MYVKLNPKIESGCLYSFLSLFTQRKQNLLRSNTTKKTIY